MRVRLQYQPPVENAKEAGLVKGAEFDVLEQGPDGSPGMFHGYGRNLGYCWIRAGGKDYKLWQREFEVIQEEDDEIS